MKVYISGHRQSRNELKVLTHIKTIETTHPGSYLIRNVLDAFEMAGQNGCHQCLVYDPLGLTLSDLRRLCDGRIPGEMLKGIINYLLLALDFLHTEAQVVHTGIFYASCTLFHSANLNVE